MSDVQFEWRAPSKRNADVSSPEYEDDGIEKPKSESRHHDCEHHKSAAGSHLARLDRMTLQDIRFIDWSPRRHRFEILREYAHC
jgi:hypothetical protein